MVQALYCQYDQVGSRNDASHMGWHQVLQTRCGATLDEPVWVGYNACMITTLKLGTRVRALVQLDPEGANVRAGEVGEVIEERDGKYGPLVRWIGSRTCNVREFAIEAVTMCSCGNECSTGNDECGLCIEEKDPTLQKRKAALKAKHDRRPKYILGPDEKDHS